MSTPVAAPVGQTPLSAAVPLTRATFPSVPLIAIVPVAFGVGRFCVPPAPTASWTNRYPPAGAVVLGRFVTAQFPVPVAEMYCTLQLAIVTGDAPGLKTSMKSFLKVA